jgi:HK97 family phage major capsid protein
LTIEEILGALQAILDAAEGRELNDEEVARYEELETQLKGAQRSAEIRSRHAAYKAPNRSDLHVHVGTARQDDTLERAFDHYLRTGKENADLVQLRAQGEGSPTEGGYLVPDGFRDKLIDRMKAFGGIANVVETITTSTGNPLPWPTVDDTANVGEIVAEGGTFASGADLVFGTASLGAYKYMAGGASNTPLRVSVELLQDAAFDVQGLVSRKLGERIARIQSTHLVTGNGSGQPKGIVHGLTPVQPAANTGWTYADLVTFIHSVDPAYRERGRWAFNDTTLGAIRKLVDLDGRPLLQPAGTASAAGSPGGETLLGYPVTIDQAFVDLDIDDSTDLCGVFGDLSEGYVMRRVKDITLIVNPWTRAANGQVEFTAWARMDGNQQNISAYSVLSGKS